MAPNSLNNWYYGPYNEHYRCHKCYIPITFGVRKNITVDWFLHIIVFPKVAADEYLLYTATNMETLITEDK